MELIRARRNRSLGQHMLEYAVLVAAVSASLIVMADYVRRAFNAQAKAIQEEMNGASSENMTN